MDPEKVTAAPDEVVIVKETPCNRQGIETTKQYGVDAPFVTEERQEIISNCAAITNCQPIPVVPSKPAANEQMLDFTTCTTNASVREQIRALDCRVQSSNSLADISVPPDITVEPDHRAFSQTSPRVVTIETTPPPQDLRVRSQSGGVHYADTTPPFIITPTVHQRPSSTPAMCEVSTSSLPIGSAPIPSSNVEVISSASIHSHRYSLTPPPSFASLVVLSPTTKPLLPLAPSFPIMVSSSERSSTPYSLNLISSMKPVVSPSPPIMGPSSERSSTPHSLTKRDEVLKSLKQEGRWSDEEEEGDEEGEDNEEEEDDDIIPLDFHIKVEEFYRDILHSNGDSEVQIEAIRPSVGGKLIRAPAAKMALKSQTPQNQLHQSSVSAKSIPASSKCINNSNLIHSKPMLYDITQSNVIHQGPTQHVGGQKQVFAQKSTPPGNAGSQPTNNGFYSHTSSIVQSTVNDDSSNHMPDVIVTATHPPCDPQQPQPQHITQSTVQQQQSSLPVQHQPLGPSVNYPVHQIYAPSLPPQFQQQQHQQQQQPHMTLALHPQQSQPHSQSIPTTPFPLSLHSLYSSAGTATTYDPVTATAHSSPVILVNLGDLRKMQSKSGETVEKVTKSTQTRRSAIKSELRHDAGGDTPAYGDDAENENVRWIESVEDFERIIEPTTHSIGTSTDPTLPSPTPRQSPLHNSSPRHGMPIVMKQIQKTTFGICETDRLSRWPDKVLSLNAREETPKQSRVSSMSTGEGRRIQTNRNCKKVASIDDASRNVEVLQSKVYIVGQGREEKEFVQNLKPRSRLPNDLNDSEDQSGLGGVEESEEENPPSKTPPKTRSPKVRSSRRKKKKAVVVEVDDGSEEEVGQEKEAEDEIEEKDDETYTIPDTLADFSVTDLRLKRNSNNMYQCRYCEREYTHAGSRMTHERKHTGELPFSCPSCERGFSHASNFKRHLKVCKDPEGADLEILPFFKCPACGQQFKYKKSLSTHYKFKHERTDIECEDCGGKFPSPAYLERHLPTCKPNKKNSKAKPEKRFYCQICGWNSRLKKWLEAHMSTMHSLSTEMDLPRAPVKRRKTSRKRESADGQVDEKPLVIDLANAKWMVK